MDRSIRATELFNSQEAAFDIDGRFEVIPPVPTDHRSDYWAVSNGAITTGAGSSNRCSSTIPSHYIFRWSNVADLAPNYEIKLSVAIEHTSGTVGLILRYDIQGNYYLVAVEETGDLVGGQ